MTLLFSMRFFLPERERERERERESARALCKYVVGYEGGTET